MKTLIVSAVRPLTGLIFFAAILVITNSCSKSSSDTGTGPGLNEVWIKNMAFTPASMTVTAGTIVTWTNKDAIAHTVTSDTGLFDSGDINPGGTFTHTFAAAGTYPYHCTIHPTMLGTITAQAGSGY